MNTEEKKDIEVLLNEVYDFTKANHSKMFYHMKLLQKDPDKVGSKYKEAIDATKKLIHDFFGPYLILKTTYEKINDHQFKDMITSKYDHLVAFYAGPCTNDFIYFLNISEQFRKNVSDIIVEGTDIVLANRFKLMDEN